MRKNQISMFIVCLLLTQICHAGIQTYTNKTFFLASSSATNCTGVLPDIGRVSGGAAGTLTVGKVTFTMTAPSFRLFSEEYTDLLPGPEIGLSERENLNAQFDAPVYSAGFDFVEPTDNDPSCPFFDSTFFIVLKSGTASVGELFYNAPNGSRAFIGVASDIPFDRLEIREVIGGCDNEFFGQFFCGISPLQQQVAFSTNKVAFLASSSSTSCSGPLPDLGLLPNGMLGSFTAEQVTFSLSAPAFELYSEELTGFLPGQEIGISERENLNAQFASPVFAAGFDFFEPSSGDPSCPYFDSTFSVTLKSGLTTVGRFDFNAPDDEPSFIGVESQIAFDRLEIREIVGGCDNEYFGQFYCDPVRRLPSVNSGTINISEGNLRWSTSERGLLIESSFSLIQPLWVPVTNSVSILNENYVVPFDFSSQPLRYFRFAEE